MKLNYKSTILCAYTGYITQAIVNIFAPLLFITFHKEFGISLSQITVITTLNFLTQLCVDIICTKFVDKIGYRAAIVAAHVFCASGLIGMAFLPGLFSDPYIGLLCSVVLYAVGGGIIEVLISPIVEACPSDNKEATMSLLHSFYCWGSVAVIAVSTVFFYIFGTGAWRVLSCLWAIIPVINAFMFTRVPIAKLTEDGEGMSVKELFSLDIFRIFVVLMLCAGASELAMSQWASAFAEDGLGVSKAIGDLAGPCMFSILMGLSRVFYAKFSQKIDLLSCIIVSSFSCIAAYLLTSLSPSPALSLAGCALCGLSVGILWPGIFSIAAKSCPKGGTAMFAVLALAGDLGCTSGPSLVGFVTGRFDDNLKAGLLSAVVFPAVLIICGIILKRLLKRKVENERNV